MIVPMKKTHFIVQEHRRTEAVQALGELGLVHVTVDNAGGENLSELQAQRHTVERAIQQLPPEILKEAEKDSDYAYPGISAGLELAEEVLTCSDRRRDAKDKLDKLRREVEWLQPWGDFTPAELSELSEHGVEIELRVVTAKEWSNKPSDLRAWLLNRLKNNCYIAILHRPDQGPIEWDAGRVVPLPNRGLSQVYSEIERLERYISESDLKLEFHAKTGYILTDTKEQLDEAIEFETVRTGMEQSEQLCIVTGFIPAEDVETVKKVAQQNRWGIVIRDPAPDEQPPTKMKNPRWVRIIQPVFNLLGTVPGYREYDISAIFLLFFAVFFGMILSDAGYGSLLLLFSLSMLCKKKLDTGRIPDAIVLMTVLSVATVVWGALTGNWFGYEPIAQTPPFSSLVIPELYGFGNTAKSVQFLCFVLGLLHLSIASLWNTKKQLSGSYKLKALAELGWFSMVLGLFFVVLMVVLGRELPDFAVPMIIGGFVAVTLFGEQEGNFIKGVGKGLAGLMPNALSGVSRFSDIVSYIRLFAVGLATLEIAKSFNQMAGSIVEGLDGSVFGIIAAILVIAIGHTINLAMAALAVVVHGVRLNMLEFSGMLGMEWTGELFRPFKARRAAVQTAKIQ